MPYRKLQKKERIGIQELREAADDALVRPWRAAFGLVLAASFLGELCVVGFYAAGTAPVLFLLVGHGAVVLVCCALCYLCSRRKAALRAPALLALLTVMLGPLGAPGTVFILVLTWWFQRSATSFEDWYAALFPEQNMPSSERVFAQIQEADTHGDSQGDSAPFADVLSFGTLRQKQQTITLITRHFHPIFAPSLKLALADESNAVRVQAATAMARIETGFLESSVKLSRAAGDSPESASILLDLARHYDDYAYAGILDGVRERENRELALDAYRKYLKKEPDDKAARAAVGRILLRERRFKEAAEWLEDSDEVDMSPKSKLWLMESWFHLGEWEKIRRLSAASRQELKDGVGLPLEVRDSLELWSTCTRA